MMNEFGISIRQDIDVWFASAAEIQRFRGEQFVPTRGFDSRAVGVAHQHEGKCTVYIEKGQPYHMIFACIVHELTHIWQYDHLDIDRMKVESEKLLSEGHAVWAEIHCLLSRGMGARYCEHEANREDEYGRGYRMIAQMLIEQGKEDAFQMLQGMYPSKTP